MTFPITDETKRSFEKKYIPEPNSGCWLWLASCSPEGYGAMSVGGRVKKRATHVAVRLSGRDIPEGSIVLHSCDNPYCVNPEHLEVGDQSKNIKDCVKRGRYTRSLGEKSGKAIFTLPQAVDIKRRILAGERIYKIARAYGVRWTTIKAVEIGWPEADEALGIERRGQDRRKSGK